MEDDLDWRIPDVPREDILELDKGFKSVYESFSYKRYLREMIVAAKWVGSELARGLIWTEAMFGAPVPSHLVLPQQDTMMHNGAINSNEDLE